MKIIDKYIFLFNFLKFRHLIYFWFISFLCLIAADSPMAVYFLDNFSYEDKELNGTFIRYSKGRNDSRLSISVNGKMHSLPYGSTFLKDPLGKKIKKYKGKFFHIKYIAYPGYFFGGYKFIYKISCGDEIVFFYDKEKINTYFYKKNIKHIYIIWICIFSFIFSSFLTFVFLIKKLNGGSYGNDNES